MTDAHLTIIELLKAHGRPMYGLDLVKASGGRLHRGTVYVDLQRLEDAGVVLSREEPAEDVQPHVGIPRPLYWLRPGGPPIEVPDGGGLVPV